MPCQHYCCQASYYPVHVTELRSLVITDLVTAQVSASQELTGH
jgi:hypothetical protein